MSGFHFEHHTEYCTFRITKDVDAVSWEEMQQMTARICEMIREVDARLLLVDMGELHSMPTGLSAAMLQIWKSVDPRGRHFAVAAPHETLRQELYRMGLDSLWSIAISIETAQSMLRVPGDTDLEIDMIASAPVSLPVAPDVAAAENEIAPEIPRNSPVEVQHQRGFDTILFQASEQMQEWSELEQATSRAIELLRHSQNKSVLIDLSQMEIINSGMVASLVRIWQALKADHGQFTVYSPNEGVTEVLKSNGLWKLWTVVDDREEAAYELGVSKAAMGEKRERRLLMLVAAPCAVISFSALIAMFLNRTEVAGVNAQLAALLLASAAVATGILSVVREAGIARAISAFSVAISLIVLSSLWFSENPISFGKQIARDLNREDEDDRDAGGNATPKQDSPSETDEPASSTGQETNSLQSD